MNYIYIDSGESALAEPGEAKTSVSNLVAKSKSQGRSSTAFGRMDRCSI